MSITSAKIKIHVRPDIAPGEVDAGYSTIHVVEGIQSNPIQASDYGAHRTKIISGGSLPFTSIDGKQGQFIEIPLNAIGISWINRGGNTKFCLRLEGEINAIEPSGINRIWWEVDLDEIMELIITEYGIETSYYRVRNITGHAGVLQAAGWLAVYNAAVGTFSHYGATLYDSEGAWWASENKFQISRAFIGFDTTGLLPVVAPTVITDPASVISQVSATENGTLDDDGGEDCECGFEWGETIAYEHGATPTQSKVTGEVFSQVIIGLVPNTTYHFRALATNSAGTGHGADRSFTTLSALVGPIVNKAYALSREEL